MGYLDTAMAMLEARLQAQKGKLGEALAAPAPAPAPPVEGVRITAAPPPAEGKAPDVRVVTHDRDISGTALRNTSQVFRNEGKPDVKLVVSEPADGSGFAAVKIGVHKPGGYLSKK